MIRLLHASDLHFGPKHLPAPAAELAELARRTRPDAIVLSGDFTQRAKPAQFRAAREYVAALAAPVAWVPGNHDVPLYRFWERLFAPFGAWRRHFAPALVRDVVGQRLAVLGVNTAHAWTTKHGRLRPGDLDDLAARLGAAPASAIRVVVAHHPVAAAVELGREPPARGGAALVEIARRHRVALVLAGHLHHGFARACGPAAADGPLVVHSGTTTSSRGRGAETGRSGLQWIELEPEAVTVERRLWSAAAAAFEPVERRRFERPSGGPAALSALAGASLPPG